MHLSRFITMTIWAMTRMVTPPRSRSSRAASGWMSCKAEEVCMAGSFAPTTTKQIAAQAPRSRAWNEEGWPLVRHLLLPLADCGDHVALVARGTEVVERVGELGVATDQVGGLDQEAGHGVVAATAASGGLGLRDVDRALLGVVDVHDALRHPVADHRTRDQYAVRVGALDPLVVVDVDRAGVLGAHPDRRP